MATPSIWNWIWVIGASPRARASRVTFPAGTRLPLAGCGRTTHGALPLGGAWTFWTLLRTVTVSPLPWRAIVGAGDGTGDGTAASTLPETSILVWRSSIRD